jgi:hypothetical protein
MSSTQTASTWPAQSENFRKVASGFFCGLVALLSGCQTGVTLPPLPVWIDTKRPPISGVAVANEARALVPGLIIGYSDSTYTLVSKEWLDAYLTWTWEAAKAADITYTPQSFDCEDFALGFHFFAARAAAKAGTKASPLIARIVVAQTPNTRHELIACATDKGIFVVEPQPDAGPFRIWELGVYPHRILSATFGDFNPY